MPIVDEPRLIEVIREAVAAVRSDPRRRKRGWYDSHCVVNYLDSYHNALLNRIIEMYADCQDPPHRATIQIGCFIRDHLGQSNQRFQYGPSKRRITLSDGKQRDGECSVSRWEISAATDLPSCDASLEDMLADNDATPSSLDDL